MNGIAVIESGFCESYFIEGRFRRKKLSLKYLLLEGGTPILLKENIAKIAFVEIFVIRRRYANLNQIILW